MTEPTEEAPMKRYARRRLRFHRTSAQIAEAFKAHSAGEVDLFIMVYHRRHRANLRPWGTGFQPTPWTCPTCHQRVRHPDDLRYLVTTEKKRT